MVLCGAEEVGRVSIHFGIEVDRTNELNVRVTGGERKLHLWGPEDVITSALGCWQCPYKELSLVRSSGLPGMLGQWLLILLREAAPSTLDRLSYLGARLPLMGTQESWVEGEIGSLRNYL